LIVIKRTAKEKIMAQDIFLIMADSSSIKGDSKDSKYSGAIRVHAFSHGLSNSGSFQDATGGGTGKVNFNDISITKPVDTATADLMLACASGKHIDSAKIVVRKSGGDDPLEYLTYTLEDVMVSSHAGGASHGDELLSEHITLNFAQITVQFQTQDDTGAGQDGGTMSWSIPANAKGSGGN
jgi:type VI secretion system secreted protein Hcp